MENLVTILQSGWPIVVGGTDMLCCFFGREDDRKCRKHETDVGSDTRQTSNLVLLKALT